jgi:hypothetical protein
MKDTRPVWKSKWHILQILQPFWKSGYWRSYCSFQIGGDFQTVNIKETQAFRHQNFQNLDANEYTYDSKLYIGKDRQRTAQHVTATHASVSELTSKKEGRGHKLYMDNFFSFL